MTNLASRIQNIRAAVKGERLGIAQDIRGKFSGRMNLGVMDRVESAKQNVKSRMGSMNLQPMKRPGGMSSTLGVGDTAPKKSVTLS